MLDLPPGLPTVDIRASTPRPGFSILLYFSHEEDGRYWFSTSPGGRGTVGYGESAVNAYLVPASDWNGPTEYQEPVPLPVEDDPIPSTYKPLW